MKKLVFSACQENIHVADTAMLYENEGNEVLYIVCDGCTGMCTQNLQHSKVACKYCQFQSNALVKKFPDSIKVEKLSDYDGFIDKKEVENITFSYNNYADIKKITFHNVNVGYACVSSYIFKTRNLNPKMDKAFRNFFDTMLKTTCYLVLLQEKIIDTYQPDEVTFFNGRFMENRTLVDLCLAKDVHYHACDGVFITHNKVLKMVFYDGMPQSISYMTKVYEEGWKNPLVPLYDKEQIGRWFFESKIKQRFTADKNYVKDQTLGVMPEGWDDNNTNFVIFNSSEDEFCAIGDEWDDASVFENQIVGIKYICETLLRERPEVKVYLRIHPNLKDIPYKYHTDLYKLPALYSNLTVIPGNSKIASYSLMEKANRIIVFGSTMGIESAYAGKTVINLAGSYYRKLNICYTPNNVAEFTELLLKENLPPLDNYNCLKYGYGMTNPDVPGYIFLNRTEDNIKHRLVDYAREYGLLYSIKYLYYRFRTTYLNDNKPVPMEEE